MTILVRTPLSQRPSSAVTVGHGREPALGGVLAGPREGAGHLLNSHDGLLLGGPLPERSLVMKAGSGGLGP